MNSRFKLALAMVLVTLSSGAVAREVRKDSVEQMIARFEKAQDENSPDANQELVKLRKEIASQGLTEPGKSSAVLLSGECGVVGCDETYLVATPYSSRGPNKRTSAISGIVLRGSLEPSEIWKILDRDQLNDLISRVR